MKKILLIGCGGLLVVLIIILVVGVKIGNVAIGRQNDELQIAQNAKIAESDFYKNHLNSNKVICLNLWATWCVPCVEEIPALNKIKQDYHSQNIEFLSMSIDTDSTRLSKFINTKRFKFEDITFANLPYKNAILNYLENEPLENSIKSQSIPITYLIKNQKVIKRIDGQIDANELAAEIDKLLK